MRNFLLSIPEIEGKHSGINIAETALTILNEFDILDRLGYTITDNASSNSVALEVMANELDFNKDHKRLRCMGHTINLIAKALQEDIECFVEAAVEGRSSHKTWLLERDNETRWNSTYKTICRAIELRQPVDAFIDQEIDVWDQYEKRQTRKRTRTGQKASRRAAITDSSDDDENILSNEEDDDEALAQPKRKGKLKKQPTIIDALCNEDWYILIEYKVILEPLWEATMRRPLRDGMTWKDHEDWIATGKQTVSDLWEKEYKSLQVENVAISMPQPDPKPLKRATGASQWLNKHLSPATMPTYNTAPESVDEYDWYIAQPQVLRQEDVNFNPIQWWRSQKHYFPRLSKMAIDLLSTPAMSAKAERIFSHTGNI
ncbi:hypothetical protein Egran_06990, partial [Elaphomyces granulatus]